MKGFLNWARPRDLSHYERFAHYHATFYQQVEALSITPFSPRACDRGLSALLVSLIRLAGRDFNGNSRAEEIERDHPLVLAAIASIAARAYEVEGAEARDRVWGELRARLDEWLARAAEPGPQRLGYKDRPDGVTRGLLHQPGPGPWSTFTCLNSLRDVEPSITLILDEGGLDTPPPSLRAPSVAEDAAGDRAEETMYEVLA